MSGLTRRSLLTTAAAVACGRGRATIPTAALAGGVQTRASRLPHGYLLVQEVCTYNVSRFGCISTTAEAEELFAQSAGRLDGLEFGSAFFGDHDLRAHLAVAQAAHARRIDLWMSTFRLASKVRAFGPIRPEFQAHVMEPDGRIAPAEAVSEDGKRSVVFDFLNPEAVEWFLDQCRRRYLEPMKGLLSGVFFNEDCLPYLAKPANDRRYDYWRTAAYSPRVLQLWAAYCRKHDVTQRGKLVVQFPVHDPAMEQSGGGRTVYCQGWDVPKRILPGQRFAELPHASGVWRHWYEFTCGLFLDNWIGRMAGAANEANRSEAGWKGALYFGLHHWSLPYEQVESPTFAVPTAHRWGAWGRQRGVDLARLAAHPEIGGIICETYPPIAANLEGFVAEFARITRQAGKTFGLMLHRDDAWALKLDEEQRRWSLIDNVRPTIIARYPLRHMLPGNQFYSAAGEEAFEQGLRQYRQR